MSHLERLSLGSQPPFRAHRHVGEDIPQKPPLNDNLIKRHIRARSPPTRKTDLTSRRSNHPWDSRVERKRR